MDNDNVIFQKSVDDATLQMIHEIEKNMQRACLELVSETIKECDTFADQGILRASIKHDVSVSTEGIVGTVGSVLEYAPYVHQGTGLYAKDGNGRKTPWGYTAIAGKYKGFHWTHGQKPNPFMERARNKVASRVAKLLGGKENV